MVKDDIEKIDWKLESDTKYIGEYQCFKATYTEMVEKPRVSFGSDEEVEVEKEPEMEERTVTAWYTPQIPVNNGPDNYQGLPGLILEVHDGQLTIICSKIVLNPEDKIEITEPFNHSSNYLISLNFQMNNKYDIPISLPRYDWLFSISLSHL